MGQRGYIIDVGGLPVGEHEFEFEVKGSFFKEENPEGILDANVLVKARVLMQNNLIQIDFEISGTLTINCDRCLKAFPIPIESRESLVVKRGDPENSDDEVLFVEEGETELDVTNYIYEYLVTSLPARRVPCEIDPEAFECDMEVLQKLEENSNFEDQNENNPLRDQLNKIKFNKN